MGVVDGRYVKIVPSTQLKVYLFQVFVSVNVNGVLLLSHTVDIVGELNSGFQSTLNQTSLIFLSLKLYDTRTNFELDMSPILIRCCSHTPVSCAESFIVQSPVMLEISSSPLTHGTIHPLVVSAPWTW